MAQLNLTDVAERHGYKTFYKLLEVTCSPIGDLSGIDPDGGDDGDGTSRIPV